MFKNLVTVFYNVCCNANTIKFESGSVCLQLALRVWQADPSIISAPFDVLTSPCHLDPGRCRNTHGQLLHKTHIISKGLRYSNVHISFDISVSPTAVQSRPQNEVAQQLIISWRFAFQSFSIFVGDAFGYRLLTSPLVISRPTLNANTRHQQRHWKLTKVKSLMRCACWLTKVRVVCMLAIGLCIWGCACWTRAMHMGLCMLGKVLVCVCVSDFGRWECTTLLPTDLDLIPSLCLFTLSLLIPSFALNR